MRKIPTLYRRDPGNPKFVTDELAVELPDDARPTAKWDGTAVRCTRSRGWWARREVKPGKTAPEGFELVQRDEVTGKSVGWVPITPDDPQWKWHRAAIEAASVSGDATFELVGPHFQANPHGLSADVLVPHGLVTIDLSGWAPADGQRELGELLAASPYEGVVWWHDDEPIAKIKRRDFGLAWPVAP